jgi:hypothetical protein
VRLDAVPAVYNEVLVPDLQALPTVASRLQGDLYFSCLGTTIKTAGSKEKFDAWVQQKKAELNGGAPATTVAAVGSSN